jgi:ABC-2 type transport system ATP-binding protein
MLSGYEEFVRKVEVMAVVVENLTVRYGDITAVNDVSFIAPSAGVTVILGPNGAGKTSTIEVCEGFRRPTSGSVSVLGLDPQRQHRELTHRMGVMLQGGGVYPSARINDVVSHFCALYGKKVNATDLIERVGLTSRAKSTWRRLSGGEQQRLSLALALAGQPDVLFLDEPTSGVDIDGRDTIRSIIIDATQQGTTVVLASHDMAEAQKVATHVVLFQQGTVIADAPLAEITQSRKRLRFSSLATLDTLALSQAIGSLVNHQGEGVFEITAESSARLVGRITQWLSEQQLPLLGIDLGEETLEDAYRRLTGDTQ